MNEQDQAFLESYRLRALAQDTLASDPELRDYYIEQAQEQEAIAYAD